MLAPQWCGSSAALHPRQPHLVPEVRKAGMMDPEFPRVEIQNATDFNPFPYVNLYPQKITQKSWFSIGMYWIYLFWEAYRGYLISGRKDEWMIEVRTRDRLMVSIGQMFKYQNHQHWLNHQKNVQHQNISCNGCATPMVSPTTKDPPDC